MNAAGWKVYLHGRKDSGCEAMTPFKHPVEFYLAIAAGIDAENRKASVYLKHGPSIGAARERILKRVIRDLTPGLLSIDPGFVHSADGSGNQVHVSRQCDLLVFGEGGMPVKYRIDDLVVVDQNFAKVAIEVKSNLDKAGFEEQSNVCESLLPLNTRVLGFAYSGVTNETTIEYLREALEKVPSHVPLFFAIHERNTFYIRGTHSGLGPDRRLCCCQFPDSHPGSATAFFLMWYRQLIADPYYLSQEHVEDWYRKISADSSVDTQLLVIGSPSA